MILYLFSMHYIKANLIAKIIITSEKLTPGISKYI